MLLVSPTTIWSTRKLNGYSWLFGTCLMGPMLLVACLIGVTGRGFSGPPKAIIIAFIVLLLFLEFVVLPLWALKRWRVQLATWPRRVRAIFLTSTGYFTFPYATILAVTLFGGTPNQSRAPGVFAFYGGFQLAIILIWIVISLIAWPIIQSHWPFRIQDGQSCPQCGYCLRGAASRVCPECGRAFDHNDLGLTEAAFEVLVSGAPTDSVAAVST